MFNILLAVVGAATLTALYLCVAYGVVAVAAVVGPTVGVTAEVEAMTRVALVGAAAVFPVAAGLCLYWFSPGTVRSDTASVLRARYSGKVSRSPEAVPGDGPPTAGATPENEVPTAEANSPDETPSAEANRQNALSPAGAASNAVARDRPTATPEGPSDGPDDDRPEVAADETELVENASR